jgi:hypothetical protein
MTRKPTVAIPAARGGTAVAKQRRPEDVIQKGGDAGHSRNAFFAARKKLGINAKKVGFDGGAWELALPEEAESSNSADCAKGTVFQNGTLRDASE